MVPTDKQQRFVTEYLVDRNATQAAIPSGYAKSGGRTEGARLWLDRMAVQSEPST